MHATLLFRTAMGLAVLLAGLAAGAQDEPTLKVPDDPTRTGDSKTLINVLTAPPQESNQPATAVASTPVPQKSADVKPAESNRPT